MRTDRVRRSLETAMHLGQRLFASIYDPVMTPLEHGRVGAQRTTLLAGTTGHVLDLGAGTGANLEHLPAGVSRVTAVEPDAAMRQRLERHVAALTARRLQQAEAAADARGAEHGAAPAAPQPEDPCATTGEHRPPGVAGLAHLGATATCTRIEVVDAVAEALPLPDDSVDVALATLVLCTVRDPQVAVAELRRVLRPDGRLLVLEHVASHRPGRHRLQRTLTPAWKVVARGCHLDRDTRSILAAGGFDVTEVAGWQLSDRSRLTAAITGVARPT